MGMLIKWELRKILHDRLVLWGSVLLLIFNIANFCAASVPAMAARTTDHEDYVSGPAAVQLEQELAKRYGDILTDEAVAQMLADLAFSEEFLARTGGVNVKYIYNNFLQQAVQTHFAEPDGHFNGLTVAEVFGSETIRVGYTAGWLATAEYMLRVMLLLSVLVVLALAPVFAGEYEGMDALLLTARYGRTRLIWAKCIAGLGFAAGLALLVLGLNYGVAWLCFGSEGLEASILFAADNPYSFIEQNLSCGQLILWQSRLAITAVLTTAALTLALSAALPNRYMALAASAGLLFLPLLVSPSPERPLYTLWMLAPAYQLLSNHLLALGTFSWGGRSLLWAWWALPASLLAVGAGLCGAKRAFGRREVR